MKKWEICRSAKRHFRYLFFHFFFSNIYWSWKKACQIIIFFKLSFWRWIWRNYKESQDERKGTTHKCQKEGKTLTLVQVRKMTPTFIGLVLNGSESKWQSTHRPWYPWSKKDPVRKLIIVQLLLSLRLCRKTEIKLRSWIWTTFLFWICFDDWKSLKKKIPKYLNLKTTFQERIWDCQQESLLVPGKTTIFKSNLNYDSFCCRLMQSLVEGNFLDWCEKVCELGRDLPQTGRKGTSLCKKTWLNHNFHITTINSLFFLFAADIFKHPQPNAANMWVWRYVSRSSWTTTGIYESYLKSIFK